VIALAVVCLGSAARYLGLPAVTAGLRSEAEAGAAARTAAELGLPAVAARASQSLQS